MFTLTDLYEVDNVGSHEHCSEPLGSIKKKCWFVAVQSTFVINWHWYHHKQQNPLSMPQACWAL